VPITDALVSEGFVVHGVDASPSLAAAWARRFPEMSIEVADVVTCRALDDTWDAIVRWGLVCLLPPDTQRLVLARIARALVPRGHLLFTALRQVLTWQDALTDVQSWSRGSWPPRPGLRARSSP
jgi:cyclopropane fatty-acyl-phospholipid synthase-like methyltransferase